MNLILHSGAQRVDRQQVYGVSTPQPAGTWYPIPHGALLDEVQSVLTANGMTVVSEAHGLHRAGARYFGMLQVANGHADKDWGLLVGVRNSHDKRFQAALALGAQVFVCDNLSFSGEVMLARKHTLNIRRDLPMLVQRAVGLLTELRNVQENRFLTYQKTELADSQAHDLVIRAVDAQIVPVTKIPDVLREWRTPRHPEFAQVGKTAWRLFNGFTEILKGRLTDLPRRTQALHGLMDGACILIIPSIQNLQAPNAVDAEFTVVGRVVQPEPQLAQGA